MPDSAAVLTGDIVGSLRAGADAVERSMAELARAAGRMAGPDGGAGAAFTRYRGDGWQIVVRPAGLALRVAVALVAALRAGTGLAETRIAIGFGAIERPGTLDLRDASGPAFTRSGRALALMPAGRRIVVGTDGSEPQSGLLEAVACLIDDRAGRWSREQAEVVAPYLGREAGTQTAIAARLGITPQAVNQRLKAASARAVREALLSAERALADWNPQ